MVRPGSSAKANAESRTAGGGVMNGAISKVSREEQTRRRVEARVKYMELTKESAKKLRRSMSMSALSDPLPPAPHNQSRPVTRLASKTAAAGTASAASCAGAPGSSSSLFTPSMLTSASKPSTHKTSTTFQKDPKALLSILGKDGTGLNLSLPERPSLWGRPSIGRPTVLPRPSLLPIDLVTCSDAQRWAFHEQELERRGMTPKRERFGSSTLSSSALTASTSRVRFNDAATTVMTFDAIAEQRESGGSDLVANSPPPKNISELNDYEEEEEAIALKKPREPTPPHSILKKPRKLTLGVLKDGQEVRDKGKTAESVQEQKPRKKDDSTTPRLRRSQRRSSVLFPKTTTPEGKEKCKEEETDSETTQSEEDENSLVKPVDSALKKCHASPLRQEKSHNPQNVAGSAQKMKPQELATGLLLYSSVARLTRNPEATEEELGGLTNEMLRDMADMLIDFVEKRQMVHQRVQHSENVDPVNKAKQGAFLKVNPDERDEVFANQEVTLITGRRASPRPSDEGRIPRPSNPLLNELRTTDSPFQSITNQRHLRPSTSRRRLDL